MKKKGGLGSQLMKLFIFASKSIIRLVNIIDVFPCSLFGDTQF